MSLTDFFVDCCMVDRTTAPDGMGGTTSVWVDGAPFRAGVTMDSSTEAEIAYKSGMKRIYKVVTTDMMTLQQNDRIKRLSDGLVLRVTSNAMDMTAPKVSTIKYRRVTAEAITE